MHWVKTSGRDNWYGYREPLHSHNLAAWVVKKDGKYVVDSWKENPPPFGPFDTLEAAKLAAEMMYG